jgi:hypothetical protein
MIIAAACFALGCSEPKGPGRPDGPVSAGSASSATSQAPASAAKAAPITKALSTRVQRRRKKKKLSEYKIPKPPPRPEGEPKNPADLKKISDAAAQGKPVAKPGAPPIERISETKLRVGRVLVDRAARRLELPAKVNMIEGILEYYGVSSNGKLHESVLELGIEPSHLHLGLILLGVEQIKFDYGDYKSPPKVVTPGGRLKLSVRFVDPKTKKTRTVGVEKWLYSRKKKSSPKPMLWTFQGSTFWQNRYGADMDRSVIALIPDQIAVIGTTGGQGNPYQGDGLGFEVHKAVIPPKGTAVTLLVDVAGDGRTPPR